MRSTIQYRPSVSFVALLFAMSMLLARHAYAGGDWNDSQIQWKSYDEGLALAKKETALSLTGSSPRWKETLASLEREAPLESPVLLAGEAGTEQEEAARALHGAGRADGPSSTDPRQWRRVAFHHPPADGSR